MKKIILIILVILWSFLIFYASSRTSSESNSKSKELIYKTSKEVIIITNKLKITNIDISNDKYLYTLTNKLNYPLRKCAHATVYFILGILLFILFRCFNISDKKIFFIVLSICFLYSLTDEYHQIYVDGRTAKFIDCLIDTFGTFIGCLIFIFKDYLNSKKTS